MTTGGLISAALAVAGVGITFVLLIFGLALAIATAQDSVVKAAKMRVHDVKRWGGRILIGVGG